MIAVIRVDALHPAVSLFIGRSRSGKCKPCLVEKDACAAGIGPADGIWQAVENGRGCRLIPRPCPSGLFLAGDIPEDHIHGRTAVLIQKPGCLDHHIKRRVIPPDEPQFPFSASRLRAHPGEFDKARVPGTGKTLPGNRTQFISRPAKQPGMQPDLRRGSRPRAL